MEADKKSEELIKKDELDEQITVLSKRIDGVCSEADSLLRRVEELLATNKEKNK